MNVLSKVVLSKSTVSLTNFQVSLNMLLMILKHINDTAYILGAVLSQQQHRSFASCADPTVLSYSSGYWWQF